jgi:LmbE family N-acetylglucosaminyl deacetylase
MSLPTVLFSCAHPDDESFMAGGLIASLTTKGVRVVLSSATSGQAGSMGEPPLCSRGDLSRIRAAELRTAAEILGIHEVILLGYEDRQLAEVKAEDIRCRLVGLIRRHRPDVVFTFDPNGFNGHPDHVAISRFTSDAVQAAADSRWCPAAGAAHSVRRLLWTAPVHIAELAASPDPHALAGVDFLIDVAAWGEQKARALRAHRTQHMPIGRHYFEVPDPEAALRREAFRQAWGPPLARRPSDNIFEGISAE